jgi:ABC-type Co2+ transport system permease subunit
MNMDGINLHIVFGTSLHVVGGSRALVLFTLVVVILRIVVANTHCVLLLFCLSSACVFYAASFS